MPRIEIGRDPVELIEIIDCAVCGRTVLKESRPATGFIAPCGRRLINLAERGTAAELCRHDEESSQKAMTNGGTPAEGRSSFHSFVEANLRKMASAVNVGYEQLTAELLPVDPAISGRNRTFWAGAKPMPFMTNLWIDPVKDEIGSATRAAHLHGVAELLAIAKSANAPANRPDTFGEVDLPAKDGWQVGFHYDCNSDLRYIAHFITPAGERIDFWEWDEGVPGRDLLMAWCGASRND